MAPIYQKYLSADDLSAIIAFNESPAGKRLAAAMPKIAAETLPMTQAIGRKLLESMRLIRSAN